MQQIIDYSNCEDGCHERAGEEVWEGNPGKGPLKLKPKGAGRSLRVLAKSDCVLSRSVVSDS